MAAIHIVSSSSSNGTGSASGSGASQNANPNSSPNYHHHQQRQRPHPYQHHNSHRNLNDPPLQNQNSGEAVDPISDADISTETASWSITSTSTTNTSHPISRIRRISNRLRRVRSTTNANASSVSSSVSATEGLSGFVFASPLERLLVSRSNRRTQSRDADNDNHDDNETDSNRRQVWLRNQLELPPSSPLPRPITRTQVRAPPPTQYLSEDNDVTYIVEPYTDHESEEEDTVIVNSSDIRYLDPLDHILATGTLPLDSSRRIRRRSGDQRHQRRAHQGNHSTLLGQSSASDLPLLPPPVPPRRVQFPSSSVSGRSSNDNNALIREPYNDFGVDDDLPPRRLRISQNEEEDEATVVDDMMDLMVDLVGHRRYQSSSGGGYLESTEDEREEYALPEDEEPSTSTSYISPFLNYSRRQAMIFEFDCDGHPTVSDNLMMMDAESKNDLDEEWLQFEDVLGFVDPNGTSLEKFNEAGFIYVEDNFCCSHLTQIAVGR